VVPPWFALNLPYLSGMLKAFIPDNGGSRSSILRLCNEHCPFVPTPPGCCHLLWGIAFHRPATLWALQRATCPYHWLWKNIYQVAVGK